ncbi:VOC family protein [Aurantivibrio infirmus]
MIGYATLGSNDVEKAKSFYGQVLALLGAKQLMEFGEQVYFGVDMSKPMLGVGTPFNKETATVGNGTMIALSASDSAMVDAVHAKALELGGTDEGAPGNRTDNFYGAYFRDLDGNKLAVFCMV